MFVGVREVEAVAVPQSLGRDSAVAVCARGVLLLPASMLPVAVGVCMRTGLPVPPPRLPVAAAEAVSTAVGLRVEVALVKREAVWLEEAVPSRGEALGVAEWEGLPEAVLEGR
jgi:hypothetical protein